MKTTSVVMIALVVLLALTLSAPILAQVTPFGFVAFPLGDNNTQTMKGNFGMPYSVGVYRVRDAEGELVTTRDEWLRENEKRSEKVGFTYGERVASKVPGGLWIIGSFTPFNLQPCKPGQQYTARVMWGNLGPEDFDLTSYYGPGDERPKMRVRRKTAKASYDLGYEVDCTKSGPTFYFAIPTSDIPSNQTTFLMLEVFGPMGKSSTKWLFWTSVATKQGVLQEPLGIARFTAPREWVEKASAEEILSACVGLESPWLTEEAPQEQTTTTTTTSTTPAPPTKQEDPTPPDDGVSLKGNSAEAIAVEMEQNPSQPTEKKTSVRIVAIGGEVIEGEIAIINQAQLVCAVFDPEVIPQNGGYFWYRIKRCGKEWPDWTLVEPSNLERDAQGRVSFRFDFAAPFRCPDGTIKRVPPGDYAIGVAVSNGRRKKSFDGIERTFRIEENAR